MQKTEIVELIKDHMKSLDTKFVDQNEVIAEQTTEIAKQANEIKSLRDKLVLAEYTLTPLLLIDTLHTLLATSFAPLILHSIVLCGYFMERIV